MNANNPSPEELGRWALRLRKALKLNQKALGVYLNYSRDVVGAFERGAYDCEGSFYRQQLKKFCLSFPPDEDLRFRAGKVENFYDLEIFKWAGHEKVPLSLKEPSGTYSKSPKATNKMPFSPGDSQPAVPPISKIVEAQIPSWGKVIKEITDFKVVLQDDTMAPQFPKGAILSVATEAKIGLRAPCLVKFKGRAPILRLYLGQNQGSTIRLFLLNPESEAEFSSAELEWIYPVGSVQIQYISDTLPPNQATA